MAEEIPDFDDMDSAEPDSDELEAQSLDDMLEDGDVVKGVVEQVRTDVGQYDSTIYTLRGDGDYDYDGAQGDRIAFWGNGSVDAQVEQAEVGAGDVLAVKRDGTYENKYGEFTNYEIRFKRFDP